MIIGLFSISIFGSETKTLEAKLWKRNQRSLICYRCVCYSPLFFRVWINIWLSLLLYLKNTGGLTITIQRLIRCLWLRWWGWQDIQQIFKFKPNFQIILCQNVSKIWRKIRKLKCKFFFLFTLKVSITFCLKKSIVNLLRSLKTWENKTFAELKLFRRNTICTIF